LKISLSIKNINIIIFVGLMEKFQVHALNIF